MEPPPIKEEIPGSQVQEFANLFSDTKEHEINKEMDPEIEITKLKIQVSELCEQISKTDRKLEAVVELINRINNDIKKLETIDENIKLILKSRENEKKNLWSLWGK